MSSNLADMTTAGSILVSPFISGLAASKAGAGWFTVAYGVGGLVVGILLALITSKIAYFLLAAAGRTTSWIAWAGLVAYMIVPFALAIAAGWGIWVGTEWFVRHIQ